MTAILLFLAVLCLVLGPAFMLLPDRRERRIASFRRRAFAAQLRVEMVQLPAGETDFAGRPLPRTRPGIAWRLGRPRPADWRRRTAPSWKLSPGKRGKGLPAGWHWESEPGPAECDLLLPVLAEILPRLAGDVQSLGEKDYEVSVIWREREEQSLLALLELLPRLAALPLGGSETENAADGEAGSSPA